MVRRTETVYSVGDNVVYPRHGAGTVTKIEQRVVLGRERDYLTIQIPHGHMTVMVPVENAERVGLREVIAADAVDEVLEVLRGKPTAMPERWGHRFKHNDQKLKTGDIFEIAEVIRNLSVRYADKEPSMGEKQMLAKAKTILAGELMYARALSEDEAAALLEDALRDSDGSRQATPPQPTPLRVAARATADPGARI
jgi:CarD family transcriptional regulator